MQVTQREYNSLKQDLSSIQNQLIESEKELQSINSALASAKAQGDLSENAEYDSANQKKSIIEDTIKNLNNSIAELKNRLANSTVVDGLVKDRIAIGDIVKIQIKGIDNLPELEEGNYWKLTDMVLSGKPLIPQGKDSVGQLLSSSLIGKEVLGRKWNGMPITFSYSDKNNKQRILTILDVNYSLEE